MPANILALRDKCVVSYSTADHLSWFQLPVLDNIRRLRQPLMSKLVQHLTSIHTLRYNLVLFAVHLVIYPTITLALSRPISCFRTTPILQQRGTYCCFFFTTRQARNLVSNDYGKFQPFCLALGEIVAGLDRC
jgi:hypothetical protein